ncbi:hypothetical protein [Fictibacillus phosphorivorans]|nr:hypothetical protein [Fictibacillus phosphorivorans]MCM3718169.1 hypothetical protein [Fictibacillus phosphorivorans]MCM3775796.1 hypothetical protein [Fictibacillus phosphorivorans]
MRNETGFAALIFFSILGLVTSFVFGIILNSKINKITDSVEKAESKE